MLASLHNCIESICQDPSYEIPQDIKRLRQANFKVEYKHRTAILPNKRSDNKGMKKPRGRPRVKKRVKSKETPPPDDDNDETSSGDNAKGGGHEGEGLRGDYNGGDHEGER